MSPSSDRSFVVGKRLAHPASGDEVVIAGISGRFPLSANIKEFQENLFNKTDMITVNRWNISHAEVPARGGQLEEVNKFDYGAFAIHPQKAEMLGPLTRNLIEVVFEALYDAGINPIELEGTKTGVFIPTLKTDCQDAMVKHDVGPPKEAYAEVHRITSANLISHLLKLNGPSVYLDTGCSASLYALEQAYKAIRTGEIDAAIVAGAMMNLHPEGTAECFRQGFLCVDGRCKAFDNRANGYVKSEAVTAIFVQKRKSAKRVYGEIKHCKINCDGFKEEGITYPSAVNQALLCTHLYQESGLNPADVAYVEAHGTGTIVGDLQEATSIDNALAKKGTLLVGSVKSNMGHAEQVAGLCSIAKAVIIMETGLVPPNLHYQQARQDIEALKVGRLKVPTEIEQFPTSQLLAVNSFGLGGTNAHLVLKANDRIKNEDESGYPRMVCVSGRTYEAVKTILDDITSKPPDVELFALLNNIHKRDVPQNRYRGTAIFSNLGVNTAISKCDFNKEDLHLLLGDFNKNIVNIGRCILELPLGETTCAKVSKILEYDFAKLLSNNQHQRLLSSIVHIVVLHLLQTLGAKVRVVSLSPYGIFAEAYSKNLLSFEEAVFIASLAVESDKTKFNDIEQYLNQNEDKNITLKSVFKHFFKSHKPKKIPFGRNRELLTVGKVDGEQDESNFLVALSRIYLRGFNLDFDKLYPKPFYPVSRGTPMISPLIKWEHSHDFATLSYNSSRIFHKLTRIDTNEARWNILNGHIVNDNKLFPGAGYLYLVWDAIAYKNGKTITDMSVVLEDVKFLKATGIPSDGKLEFLISLHCVNGKFTVFESGDAVCTGKVFVKRGASDRVRQNVQLLESDVVIDQNAVYQEFCLRGYNFGTISKSIGKCSVDFLKGTIRWDDNWVAFIDSVLQAYILSVATKNLLVLSDIQSVTIEPKFQSGYKDPLIPYNFDRSTDSIRCGGVEVTKVNLNVLPKKASVKKPILEEYKFVPNEANLSTEESVRVNMQIALELNTKNKIKVVEIAGAAKILLPNIIRSLENDPVMEVEAILLSRDKTTIPQVKTEDVDFETLEDVYMVIGRNLLSTEKFKSIRSVLIENGFILSRESVSTTMDYPDLTVLTIHTTPTERFVLTTPSYNTPLYQTLEITNNLNWIKPLQHLLKSDDEVVVYSFNQDTGVVGLSKTLRREGKKVRSLLVYDQQVSTFDFYHQQLKKGFATNVFKDGKWGTYRCFPAKALSKVKREHCFVRANTESSEWIVGHLNSKVNLKPHENLVHVYYSSLNPKDALIAARKIRSTDEQLLGMEYSGKLADGRKVMGIVRNGGSLASLITVDKDLMLEVPQDWTLEDAATIPIAYAVALYALKQINAKKHKNILIHCEADGVGQAAINVSYSMGLNVFVTTVNEAKRVELQKAFPQLDATCFGCCGNAAFERFIKRTTKGKGVDVVLSSMTRDNHKFALSCLAKQGLYLAINTTNTLDGKTLQANFLSKEIQFHSITLNSLFLTKRKSEIINLLIKAFQDGIVKPLKRNTSYESGITQVFKSIASQQNFEKALIKIRPEDRHVKPPQRLVNGTPRYYPEGSLIVTGGLGGFGMELIDWLIERGATKIVISNSRSTLSGYEAYRLSIWKQRGVEVLVSAENITTEEGCRLVLESANNMAPLGGIFHLAAIFNDALFEHQTQENFESIFAVKTQVLQHFDKLTRSLYPSLRDFVVFSSISSSRPNPGQTNYVYANSAMERICERRKEDGLSGIAIQWGIVGDVGIVHRSQEKDSISDISRLVPQSIWSCLEVLDNILTQKPSIISSALFKEKKTITTSKNSIADHVANVIGIKDMKTISRNATLAELGMDSITATLIRQKLEREFDIVLSFKELRRQTFAGLEELTKTS